MQRLGLAAAASLCAVLAAALSAQTEFSVNTYISGTQDQLSLAALEDGGFIVTYTSYAGDGNNSWAVMGQRYDASGSPVGDELPLVSDYVSNQQSQPSVTGLADGGFVATWYSDGSSDVRGQIYDADGTPLNDEFRVNTYDSSTQSQPSVTALVDGGFVVTWQDSSGHSVGSNTDIRAQRFSADGTKGIATTLGDDLNSSFTFTGVDDYSLINLGEGIDTITLTRAYSDIAVRWTGLIQAPADGEITFHGYHDDGARLTIGGTEVFNNWSQSVSSDDQSYSISGNFTMMS